jgi:PKD repeat protein
MRIFFQFLSFLFLLTTIYCCKKEKTDNSDNNQTNPIYPVASFESFFNKDSCSALFVSSGTNADSVKWLFGNGTTSNQQVTKVDFDSSGTYKISLIAMNSSGVDTFTKNIVILSKPKLFMNGNVSVNNDCGCGALHVNFNLLNYLLPQMNYSWTFGDMSSGSNNFSTMPSASHFYSISGSYLINLTVKDSLSNVIINPVDTIKIFDQPIADIYYSPVITNILNPEISFYCSSTDFSYYKYYFGDGTTSEEMNPVHTYSSVGKFNIIFIAKTVDGCYSYTVKTIRIDPLE